MDKMKTYTFYTIFNLIQILGFLKKALKIKEGHIVYKTKKKKNDILYSYTYL